MPEGSTIRDCLADELQRRTCFSLMSASEKFLYSYIIDYHVVERALKERHLKGQSDRAVIRYMHD